MPNMVDLIGHVSLFAMLTIVVAIAAFSLAVAYAVRPTEQKLMLMRPVSLATIFTTISGLFGGWIALLASIPAPADGALPAAVLYSGLAESLVVGLVSFGLLGAGWMLVAVGALRRDTGAGSVA